MQTFKSKFFYFGLSNFPRRAIPLKSLVTRSHTHKLTEVPWALQIKYLLLLYCRCYAVDNDDTPIRVVAWC